MNAMMLLMMPSVSCDADTGANSITLPRSHAAPHSDQLDLPNGIVPLTISVTTHATNASTNGIP